MTTPAFLEGGAPAYRPPIGMPRVPTKVKDPWASTNNIVIRTRCHPRRQAQADQSDGLCLTPAERKTLATATGIKGPVTPPLYAHMIASAAAKYRCAEPSVAERCVLSKVLRTNATQIFAPDAPASWSDRAQEWMSDRDIEQAVQQYTQDRGDVMVIPFATSDFQDDKVCHNPTMCSFDLKQTVNRGIVHVLLLMNKDKWNGPGTHWVAFYMNVVEGIAFYFDSLGHQAPRPLTQWVHRVQRAWRDLFPLKIAMMYYENRRKHQRNGSNCGIYALYMMTSMIEPTFFAGSAHPDSIMDKIRYFMMSTHLLNDYMQRLRHYYYNYLQPPRIEAAAITRKRKYRR